MRIDSNHHDGEWILALTGDLDLAAVGELKTAGELALRNHQCDALLIDLANVPFIDAAGIGALIYLRNVAEPRPVTLRNLTRQVRRVLDIVDLAETFEPPN